MAARDCLDSLRRNGFTVTREGGTLYVSPSDRLTPVFRAMIKEYKPALLALLAAEAAAPTCPTCAAPMTRVHAEPPVPGGAWWCFRCSGDLPVQRERRAS